MSSEADIEKEIVEKGLVAPRITPDMIDEQILAEYYIRPTECSSVVPSTRMTETALGCLTICVLVLRNGFTVTGESACASPENFNKELGRKVAKDNARQKIWALEGYYLRNKLIGRN